MGKDKRGLAVAVAAVAAGVGYLTGILTAPKSGKETRQDIQRNAATAKREAEKKLKEVHAEISDLIDEGAIKAKDAKATTQKEIRHLVDQAKDAKGKAREVLSAVHEGGAEDADLDKAIRHAKRAIKNLKDYLKSDA